jgi:hypothetical protein
MMRAAFAPPSLARQLFLVAQPLGPRPLKLYPAGGDRFFMLIAPWK